MHEVKLINEQSFTFARFIAHGIQCEHESNEGSISPAADIEQKVNAKVGANSRASKLIASFFFTGLDDINGIHECNINLAGE